MNGLQSLGQQRKLAQVKQAVFGSLHVPICFTIYPPPLQDINIMIL